MLTLSFHLLKKRANIADQSALAQVAGTLINQITPLTLGNVNRQNSHIRLVARKLLTSRKEKMDEEKINTIIETLTEKIYSHGHGIGRKEAKGAPSPQINLNVNLQLPPDIQPAQIPQQAQQILQQLMAQISQNITQLVQQEIIRQSPIIGIGGRVYGVPKWLSIPHG